MLLNRLLDGFEGNLTSSKWAAIAKCSPDTALRDINEPSRTVFKCNTAGKIVYSDSPCLGAERIEVEPTRGVDATSGRKAVGSDIRREQHREQFAEALRPLTGMDAKQLDAHGRRTKLAQEAQRECASLDKALPVAEKEEGQGAGLVRTTAQERLYGLRTRFRELRC